MPLTVGHSADALEIRLLGCLEVVVCGHTQPLPASRKTRALLAYLSLAVRPCRREDLCDLLWNDVADPRGELRWSLSKLRKVLGPWLVVANDSVAIAGEGLTVDAVVFRRLAAMILSGQQPTEPLPPWRGHPLADVDVCSAHRFHTWWTAEQEALTELHVQVLHQFVDRLWSSPQKVLAAARNLVAQYPLDEWGHARVAQALQRAGRAVEARTYGEAMRRALGRELGLPASAVMASPPAEPSRSCSIKGTDQTRIRDPGRSLLGVLPLQVSPEDEAVEAVAVHLRSELAYRVWCSRVCDVAVLDWPSSNGASRPPQYAYALQGALTRLDDGLHLSLRCVNTRRGRVFWAAQFGPAGDGRLSGWIGRAVGGLQSSIQIAEMRRSQRDSDGDSEAGNPLLEALAFASALQPVANRQALAILGRILDDEPDEPRGLALAAWCYAQRCVYNWSANVDADRREAESLAIAATLGGADDPNCLTVIAAARSLIADHHGAGLLLSRALQINPHSSSANARSGWLANYQDQPDRAIRRFQWALELAPFDPAAFNSLIGLGVAYFIRTEYGTAISHMEKGLALNPHAIWAYRNLVPAYVAAGRQADAERGIHTLLNEHPSLSVAAVDDAMVFSGPMMARLSDGLARAGLSPV